MSPKEKAEHVLSTFFLSDMERLNEGMPDFLYHYTSAAGMEGILNSGCFWANNVQHQNDLAELRVAASIFRASIERFRVIDGHDDVMPLFDALRQIMSRVDVSDVYVLSLVANGDDDNLWRLYGDRGKGVSLTFPTLWSLDWNENWMLVKVQYGEDAVRDFSERSLRMIRTIYRQDLFAGDALPPEEYANLLFENVRWFAPAFKLNAWADEKEWRLFRIGSGDERQQRPDGRYFLKAPSKSKLRIAAAAFGPQCPPETAVQIRKAAHVNGYGVIDFHHSQFAAASHRQAVDDALRNAEP
jgi:hypothetical protein